MFVGVTPLSKYAVYVAVLVYPPAPFDTGFPTTTGSVNWWFPSSLNFGTSVVGSVNVAEIV